VSEGTDKGGFVRNPALLAWMAHLLVGSLENKPSLEAARRHCDYILDTYLRVGLPVMCSAWLGKKLCMERAAEPPVKFSW
jgi:hypothetical protein